MELKEITEKTLEIFNIKSVSDLGDALDECCKKNEILKIEKFADMVDDLSVDWLQMIFQYYEADRKEKKQDYTPKSLAEFANLLCGEDEKIIDMCAGSGSMTIQRWNKNHDTYFEMYEIDEKAIQYLVFNMVIRNIQCKIYHSDVLQGEIYREYEVKKGERFGICKEVVR